MSIVVTCASSQTGSAAVEALGGKCKAVVRSPSKADALKKLGAEVIIADTHDAEKFTEAIKGSKAVYVMNPPAPMADDVFAEAQKTADSLKKALEVAKPERVVVLSSFGAEKGKVTGQIYTVTILEEALANVCKETVFLRASSFYENMLGPLQGAKGMGTYNSVWTPVDRPIPMVATKDIGRAIARWLTAPIPKSPYVVEVTGPADVSANQAGAAISAALGKQVSVQGIPDDQLEAFYQRVLPSPSLINPLATMVRAVNNGTVVFGAGDTTERGELTVEEFFKSVV